jgi:predicted HTH transcriptional regulator
LTGHLPELSLNVLELARSRGRITIGEIALLTNANRNTIKKQLKNLVEAHHLKKNGAGKGTWYSL